jgi:GNAT superfamily N-acetyltransferase
VAPNMHTFLEASVRPISANEAQSFRDRVLRLGTSPGQSIYSGDDAPDTLHLGAFVGGQLVSAATICREPMSSTSTTNSWRLRGMATLEEFRGKGWGKHLGAHCVRYVISQGGTRVWCTARMSASRFYHNLGFKKHGEPFRLPEYSDEDYIFMLRDVAPRRSTTVG